MSRKSRQLNDEIPYVCLLFRLQHFFLSVGAFGSDKPNKVARLVGRCTYTNQRQQKSEILTRSIFTVIASLLYDQSI